MLLRVLQGDMRFLKDLRYSAVIFGFRKISITSENEINKCSILKKWHLVGVIKFSTCVAIS